MDHIKKGSTQIKAFEEVAKLIGRSPSANAFRWNGVVRHQYENEILKIKKEVNANNESELDKEYTMLECSSNTRSKQAVSPQRLEAVTALSAHDFPSEFNESMDNLKTQFITLSDYIVQLESTLAQRNNEIAELKKEAQVQNENHQDLTTLFALLNKAKESGIMERLG